MRVSKKTDLFLLISGAMNPYSVKIELFHTGPALWYHNNNDRISEGSLT